MNIKKPLVSVITPSYNQGEFIKETIDSVLSQDYSNIEYIVIDAMSTDNTLEILKSYGDKIKWVSEKDAGQADAVNKGIQMAKGEIIGWLNSDDTYYPGAISAAVGFLTENPDSALVYGEANYTDRSSNVTRRYHTEKYSRDWMSQFCIICQPSAFFRKAAIEDVGLLDISYQCSMDYELWMRMAEKYKFSYIPYLMATSRMYEENKSSSRIDEVCGETFRCHLKYYGYVRFNWVLFYAKYLIVNKGNKGRFKKLITLFPLLMHRRNIVLVLKQLGKKILRVTRFLTECFLS